MAFKMKGSPMTRNFGIGSAMKKGDGDPEKKNSTSVTANLLNNLENYESVLEEKKNRDLGDSVYNVSDLKKGDYDTVSENPANKKEIDRRSAEGKKKQDKNKAQSTESFVADKSVVQASDARSAEKVANQKASSAANKAEVARRNSMTKAEKRKEDRKKKKNK